MMSIMCLQGPPRSFCGSATDVRLCSCSAEQHHLRPSPLSSCIAAASGLTSNSNVSLAKLNQTKTMPWLRLPGRCARGGGSIPTWIWVRVNTTISIRSLMIMGSMMIASVSFGGLGNLANTALELGFKWIRSWWSQREGTASVNLNLSLREAGHVKLPRVWVWSSCKVPWVRDSGSRWPPARPWRRLN